MKIGETVLPFGMALAPMAGVTDVSFRKICYDYGAEYFVSEMLSAKALCYEQIGKRKDISGTAPLAAITYGEGPTAVQIFGCEPEFMSRAARMLETREYRGCISEKPPVAIDINMGCPMRKIVGNGEGSALMKDPEKAGRIMRAVADAVPCPATAKIRAGWDESSRNAVEVAKILEANGAAFICVHGRTRKQMYAPPSILK
jgi:tRNA-dihydrouridine synthase B